ncbi:MAG: ester cyclase [Gammaproteobacteria bacterium]
MSEQNKHIVRRALEEIWQQGHVASIEAFYAKDFFNHTLASDQEHSLEMEKQIITRFREAFPDFRVIIDDLLADGDKVIVRGNWQGTHEGEFMGAAATGKKITVSEIAIFRLANGKIAELWANTDQLNFLHQLGLIGQTSLTQSISK